MDDTNIGNANPSNGETTAPEAKATEATAPEVDVAKIQETNKQLFERAKKAEAEARELREKMKSQTPASESQQPNDVERLDRLELAANDIKHPDEQKIVLDEAKRLKLSVSELASMEYMQAKLKASREAREARDGLPSGTRRANGVGRNDVEYYLANPDKRPDDQALAEKVLAAKQAQQASANRFSDIMY